MSGFGLHRAFTPGDSVTLMEWFWEDQPERVKVPYMKVEQTQQDPEYHETRETLWERAGTTP